MDTIYNIIFLKKEWTKETSLKFLVENKFEFKSLEETGEVLCFLISEKDITTDTKPSLLLSLTETVFIIVKDNGTIDIESDDDEKETPLPSLESSVESLIDLTLNNKPKEQDE